MTFDQAWDFTDPIPGSFTRRSGEAYYRYALQVPPGEVIVEVGVDQGRSASLLLQAAELTGARLVLVDSWESVLIDNLAKVLTLVGDFPGVNAEIIHARSVEAAKRVPGPIAMVHIDANHYDDNPANDCEAWLPKLKSGGIACFHDVHSSFPAVTAAVDKYTAGWQDLGEFDGLAIRRKP